VFFTIPLYLQLVLGMDALETGLKMLPTSIAMFLAAAVGSRCRPATRCGRSRGSAWRSPASPPSGC